MHKLYFERTTQLAGIFQSYSIIVNGQNVGGIKRGEKFVKDLPKGKYTFKMKHHLYSSPEIEVDLNKDTYIQVSSYKYAGFINVLTLILMVVLIVFIKEPNVLIYILPLLLLTTGFNIFKKTIQRKKYISIQSSNSSFNN